MIKFGLQVHITEKCRYNCTHCYMDRNPVDMDNSVVEAIKEQITSLKKNGIRIGRISLTGGDPLCHPNWEHITSEFFNLGLKIKFLGTPKTLTADTINLFHKYNMDSFQVSLDGLQIKHESIRGEKTFQETIDALLLLHKNGILPHIMFTVNEYNKSDLIPLIDYLHTLDIPILFGFDFCVPIGNASKNNLFLTVPSRKEIIEIFCQKQQELNKLGTKLLLCEKSHYINAYKYKKNSYMEDAEKEYTNMGGCSAGWSSLSIMPNGDVYPCRRLPYVLGNVLKDDLFGIIMNHDFMRKLRNRESFGLCSSCEKYLVCRGCPAVEYASTGDFSPKQCEFYSKRADRLVNLNETFDHKSKLLMNIINVIFETDSFVQNKDFLRSFYILKSKENQEDFVKDPNGWMKKNNFNLTRQEIIYLLSSYYLN